MSSAVTSKARTNLDDPGLIIAVEPAADGGTLLKTLGGGCIHVVDSPQETRRHLLSIGGIKTFPFVKCEGLPHSQSAT